jgi:hypothetical protein
MSRAGVTNFSSLELDILLNLIEKRLPFGQEHYEELALEFNRKMRQLNPNSTPRSGESLRNKFKSLRSKAKPTDPSCPPEVVRAKRAHKRIEEKMGVCDFDDD